jgi:hypothetical protein
MENCSSSSSSSTSNEYHHHHHHHHHYYYDSLHELLHQQEMKTLHQTTGNTMLLIKLT